MIIRPISIFIALSFAALPACPGAAQENRASDAFTCNGMDSREVLAAIVAQGADLTRRREALFYFYAPEQRLGAFQHDLEALGFSVRPTRTEPGRIAAIETIVDEHWLSATMPRLCAAAARHQIEYDGWEAAINELQNGH